MPIVPVQCRELSRGDPPREHVVVVPGDGDHREDLAVLRIHRDADRLRELVVVDSLPELGVEKLLQTVVDGERDRVADGCPLQRERLDLAQRGVTLDLAPPVRAAEILLVDAFDPGPADVVVPEVAGLLELLELLLRDRPGVPHDGRVESAIDIEADALGVDADAGEELGALGDGEGDLARHRRLADADRLVRIADPLRTDGFADGVARKREERPESLRELLLAGARQVDRNHADRETRDVSSKDIPGPVDDATALRRHRQSNDPVLLGEHVVVIPAQNLEVVQPDGERREDQEDRNAESDEAPDRYESARILSHQTPNAPCFSVTRRRSRATG